MGNKVRGFMVTLEEDIREDEMDNIVNAIAMIKGVIHIAPKVANWEDHISDQRAKNNIRKKMYEFIETQLQ